ncbi:unnamed protein product [Rotaria sp. Silwood1]|nr:unnamed protein product [Rotaria sp. Silwood1]CAF1540081.1 unnamed protein product [Rotaria sp. Silwood1]CAF3645495.1 unnamed protein product [Rotaria sp. Silwood1]CAF3656671.1 unnamed protein product [Rotaria sp. Silwood1]CAF3684527.1 unnamed protein product [Rotaria sp. Silwood1]
MATVNESNLCSICNKSSARYFCIGCKSYFCPKDFKEHEQQLWMKFDSEIVRSHDELLDQLRKLEKSNCLSLEFFDQIEQWKKITITKIEKAAEKAHHELIDKQRIKLTQQLEPITKEICCRRDEENFLENDIDQLKQRIDEIQQILQQFIQKDTNKIINFNDDKIDWNQLIYIRGEQQSSPFLRSTNLNANAKWIQHGVTVAGGNGYGSGLNQLHFPWGLCIDDDDQTIYIAEYYNNRIVEWKYGATTGRIVAGGNGLGNHLDQFNSPRDVIIDKETNSLIISDYGNKRVVRWPRQNGTNGVTIISNIGCFGLAMDDERFLYVVDHDKHEVKRYRMGENRGKIIAGGNGQGDRLDQLNHPAYIFVDRDHSVYVSDYSNHRIIKWMKDAKQGIVVAGGQGQGNSLTQLSNPSGVVVDQSGTVYVTDTWNHRIIRWSHESTEGNVIVNENGQGSQSNQLSSPTGLSFDQEGNVYVSDQGNHRVQKFIIARN